MSTARTDLRNVAIVAHVDHGKTTLVDAMLRQAGAFTEHQAESVAERVMDSGDLEREKGITILAKNTAVHYAGPAGGGQPMVINIIDTPGHADFGGEVERGLSMVDGIVLLVDASEGPLPQTRFVLRKALNADMPVILVVNKTDRGDARIAEVVDETYELFMDLLDEQPQPGRARLPGRLRVGPRRRRRASSTPENGELPDSPDLEPLFKTILETIPAPTYTEGAPLQAHVTNLDASPFLGRLALVRVHEGTLKQGPEGRVDEARRHVKNVKITELLVTEGLERKPGESAGPGDIVADRRHPRHHHRRDPRRPGEPGRAAAHPRRRAGHLDDHRHQHLAAGRPGQGRARSPPAWSRTASTPSWSATSRCGSSRPSAPTPGRSRAAASWRWRSSSSRCAARASSSPSASRRWSPRRSTARSTSRSSA